MTRWVDGGDGRVGEDGSGDGVMTAARGRVAGRRSAMQWRPSMRRTEEDVLDNVHAARLHQLHHVPSQIVPVLLQEVGSVVLHRPRKVLNGEGRVATAHLDHLQPAMGASTHYVWERSAMDAPSGVQTTPLFTR